MSQSLVRNESELGRQAKALYETLRPTLELPENIGKIVVLEPESGDFELDDATALPHQQGIRASRRLRQRQPGRPLYALRIGYRAVESFAGVRVRDAQ